MNTAAKEKCFACDRPLGTKPAMAVTSDGQHVFVGLECFRQIVNSGDAGYQPPLGGPRLFFEAEAA